MRYTHVSMGVFDASFLGQVHCILLKLTPNWAICTVEWLLITNPELASSQNSWYTRASFLNSRCVARLRTNQGCTQKRRLGFHYEGSRQCMQLGWTQPEPLRIQKIPCTWARSKSNGRLLQQDTHSNCTWRQELLFYSFSGNILTVPSIYRTSIYPYFVLFQSWKNSIHFAVSWELPRSVPKTSQTTLLLMTSTYFVKKNESRKCTICRLNYQHWMEWPNLLSIFWGE